MGEFFVQVDGETVIAKQGLSFPPESEIVSAVSKKLG